MNNKLDEGAIQKEVETRRTERIEKRKKGWWGGLSSIWNLLDMKNRWLLYVAVFISAALTGSSVFIILAGDSTDPWRLGFAALFAVIAVAICEPALLWWLNRVEYNQGKVQGVIAVVGLVASIGMTAKTVWSAGELLVWALGSNVFSSYTAINPNTQDWLVHFVPVLVMIHIVLGLAYFTFSAESTARRSIETVRRDANTRILTAKADMEADKAESMSLALAVLIKEMAPRVGIQEAQKELIRFMVANGFDTSGDGKIDDQEFARFQEWSKSHPQEVRDAISRNGSPVTGNASAVTGNRQYKPSHPVSDEILSNPVASYNQDEDFPNSHRGNGKG